MLAKKTSKNQLTLPKAVVGDYPDVDYFDVRDEDGRIVLVPLRPIRAHAVRLPVCAPAQWREALVLSLTIFREIVSD